MINMKKLVLPIFFSLLLFGNKAAFADSKHHAIHTMAEIMLHLNHYPSGSEKGNLNKIIKGETATKNERTIARAMINLKHSAAPADKKRLQEIINDSSASKAEKILAGIISKLNHQPTGRDKAQLTDLVK